MLLYDFQSLVNLEGDKLIEKHTNNNLQGAEMNIQRWIDGQTMMVVSSGQITDTSLREWTIIVYICFVP